MVHINAHLANQCNSLIYSLSLYHIIYLRAWGRQADTAISYHC